MDQPIIEMLQTIEQPTSNESVSLDTERLAQLAAGATVSIGGAVAGLTIRPRDRGGVRSIHGACSVQ